MRVVLVAVVVGVIAAGCSRASDAKPSSGDPVADAYARMAAAMSRDGSLFRTVMTEDTTQGDASYRTVTDATIDLEHDAARSEVSTAFNSGEMHRGTWLVAGDAWYQTQEDAASRKRQARRCHGAPSAALAVVLGCASAYEASSTSVDADATFEGKPAVALVTSGTDVGAGEIVAFTKTLYLDPATYLPIALEGDGTIQHGGAIPLKTSIRYENSLANRASVDAAAFDPASIGYAETDVLTSAAPASRAAGAALLAKKIEPVTGLPALELRQASVLPPGLQALTGYGVMLSYGRADDAFAPPEVTLREWRASDWSIDAARARGEWWAAPCATETPIDGVTDGVLYAGDGCGGDASGRYAARARVRDRVIVVEAAPGSRYASVDGIGTFILRLGPPNP